MTQPRKGVDATSPSGAARTSFSMDDLLQMSHAITIGELSARFAHEVSDPLMLIRGRLRFIEEKLGNDHPLHSNFEAIDWASRHIEGMLQRILEFNRERGYQKEKCRLAELVSDALYFVRPHLQNRYADIRILLDPNVPILEIHRWQFVQVLVFLLNNIADAAAEVGKRFLLINGHVGGRHIQLGISDTGLSIPVETLPHLFQPFFKTKGERGTGLGLYVAKEIVEAHGGTIIVEGGDHGTTFVIGLPLIGADTPV